MDATKKKKVGLRPEGGQGISIEVVTKNSVLMRIEDQVKRSQPEKEVIT